MPAVDEAPRLRAVAALFARYSCPHWIATATRPSDALTARLIVARSGTGLFLGLGAIVPLVGAIGIANAAVIAVLERVIGALAGLYPATRAARLAPTDALRTT